MEKWEERGKEIKANLEAEQRQNDNFIHQHTNCFSSSKKVVTTTKGEPVCLLCKRKFLNVEKLRQHESVSKLHKHNLALQRKNEKQQQQQQQGHLKKKIEEYRDRAQQRRDLYGMESSAMLPAPMLNVDNNSDGLGNQSYDQPVAEIVRPTDTLGDNNVGNQMLQKLGWKTGSSLGRKPNNTDGSNQADSNLKGAIVKDWERIESIAGN